jgi:formimidoylglutamate deiminase
MVIHAKAALLNHGWADNVRFHTADGLITSIETGVSADVNDERHDVIVPTIPNLHSHAFQRAMAGMTEVRGATSDSFWSWRELMYRFALSMTPDQMEAVAAQLYMEMLEAGFGRVGEFHYLHHDISGSTYDNIAEMAERIAAAAHETGISLTLLPVLYAHSGFGGLDPVEGQRRFTNSPDQFEKLFAVTEKLVANLPHGRIGVAPHSLRAVTPAELEFAATLAGSRPIHIHIAEQVKEVDDCLAWSGRRPVEWLVENADVGSNWCLIHATHMTSMEVQSVAKSGAVAGLCPVTEANLGDGIFAGAEFKAQGGAWGVGSDSNVLIGLSDELRQYEYSQRLANRARNVLASANQSTGRALFDAALKGGNQALAAPQVMQVGSPADFVSLNLGDAQHLSHDMVLDGWIFGNMARPDCVWMGGVKRVSGGRHIAREAIEARFIKVMGQLLAS